MNIVQKALFASSLPALLAIPAMAGVTVGSPYNGEQVVSPFGLSASASNCSSQNVGAMGYSLDNSSDTTIVDGNSINAKVQAGGGSHILHVKAWGTGGAGCVTDVSITVNGGATASLVPEGAESVHSLQTMSNWVPQHDTATRGSSNGWTSLDHSPSMSGTARKFVSNYSDYGGQRFELSFGDDTWSHNFFYDAWVYLPYPSTSIENIEMDMNQVMSNGQTVIFGFQCDGWSGTWDYTANAGSPSKWIDTWKHSRAGCNPRQWKTNTWHHVQVSYSRDDEGKVTYKSVWLDGVESGIWATVPSAFDLGWRPSLVTNLQIDGSSGSGATATMYLDEVTVSRW